MVSSSLVRRDGGGRSVCVAILIGLGYRHLSMNGRSVARVKYLLRHIDFEDAKPLPNAQRRRRWQPVRHQVAAFIWKRRGIED